jgi:hypothetical protein
MSTQSNDLPVPHVSQQQDTSAASMVSPVDAYNMKLKTSSSNSKEESRSHGNSADVVDQQSGKSSFSPVIAADADLIEKEWVLRAKAIVSKTKNDPREQSSALNRYKADYIKKRYNKDIKVSDK